MNFVYVAERAGETKVEFVCSWGRDLSDLGEHVWIELIGEVEGDAEARKEGSGFRIGLVVVFFGDQAGFVDVGGHHIESGFVGGSIPRGEGDPHELGGVCSGTVRCGQGGVFLEVQEVVAAVRFRLERKAREEAGGSICDWDWHCNHKGLEAFDEVGLRKARVEVDFERRFQLG